MASSTRAKKILGKILQWKQNLHYVKNGVAHIYEPLHYDGHGYQFLEAKEIKMTVTERETNIVNLEAIGKSEICRQIG